MASHRFEEGHEALLRHVLHLAVRMLPVLGIDPRVIHASVDLEGRAAILGDLLPVTRLVPDSFLGVTWEARDDVDSVEALGLTQSNRVLE